jgi:glycosyltransferase involved in cell wall biosynthesis
LSAFAESGLASQAELALVGDGDLRAGYEQRATDLGLANAVKFLGRISEDDLVTAYQCARVTVLPSTTGEEAFGVVLAEAMACGSPVITSDLPGLRANVTNGVEGILVPPGGVSELAAALLLLAEDDHVHARMRSAALQTARTRFSQAGEAELLDSVFTQLRPRSG